MAPICRVDSLPVIDNPWRIYSRSAPCSCRLLSELADGRADLGIEERDRAYDHVWGPMRILGRSSPTPELRFEARSPRARVAYRGEYRRDRRELLRGERWASRAP